MVAACISIVLGVVDHGATGWYEGAAIWFAIILVTIISAFNNYSQQAQFAAVDVSKQLDPVTVIRSGRQFSLDPTEILVGDLVALAAGQRIPADGILVQIKGAEIKVNESSHTGETGHVIKTLNGNCLLLGGTEVVQGSCVFLVLCVGVNTSYGMTLAALVEEDTQTPLQRKLEKVATLVGWMGTAFAAATFVALVIYWGVNVGHDGGAPSTSRWSELLDIAVVCVSIIVVAVPEGLPLAVTVSLAYSMKAMLRDHILVRELSACETMGNATAICSDKTGTLTQNRMTVMRCYIGQTAHERPPAREELHETTLRFLEQSIILNSAAWIEDENVNLSVHPSDWKWKDGNQTEISMLAWLIGYGFDVNECRMRNAPFIRASEPFDSLKKYSTIIMERTDDEIAAEGGKRYRQFFKGAGEAIIAASTKSLDREGREQPLPNQGTGAMHRDLLETVSDFSRRGLRVIGFSYRDLDQLPKKNQEAVTVTEVKEEAKSSAFTSDPAAAAPSPPSEAPEEDVIANTTLIGLVGLSDPLRPTSYRSVRLCQRAGIIVRMVTG